MKHFYLSALFSICFGFMYGQADWNSILPPLNIQVSSTVNQYQVDDNGNIFAIYSYYDGSNQRLIVEQYIPLTQTWASIFGQNIPNSINKIKVDKNGGNIYFSFVAVQFPTPLFKVYKISNGSVSLIINDLVPEYYQNTEYDFKAGDQPGELYWYFQNINSTDYSLGSWDQSLLDIVVSNIPQFNGRALTGLQMQQVGDTLWFASGVSTTDTRLVKTHETNIVFNTFDGSAQGIFQDGGNNLFAEYTLLLSNRIDKLTVHSLDASNIVHELTGVNGVFSPATVSGDYFNFPTNIGIAHGSNKAYAFTNFALDPSGATHELKLLEKDYGTDSWSIVGPAANQIFRTNENFVTRATMGYSEYTGITVVGYDSAAAIVPRIHVLNTPPDVGTAIMTLENTLCPGTAFNLFSELSIEDDNYQLLKIVDVTSTDISIINPSDVTPSTGALVGKKQYFVVSVASAVAGICDLTFFISDGYDTVTVTKTVTIANIADPSLTGGSVCGGGGVNLTGTASTGTIDWYSVSSGGTIEGSGTSFTTPYINTPTTYYAEAVDNGCISSRVSVLADVYSLPAIDAGTDQSICTGQSVTLSGSGGVSYSWNNGVTDGVPFSPGTTTNYVLTGTDANGCTTHDTVLVTVNALPPVDAGANQTVCDGSSITLSGSGAATYSWDNGISDGVAFTINASTVFTVTGTDANGCVSSDAVFVIVHALPNVNAGNDIDLCSGSSITLFGAGASTYTWDNGVSDAVAFTPAGSATYTVTGTDGNGCVNTDQLDINVNALPTVDAGLDQTVCVGDNIVLSGSGASSYIWDNGASDGVGFAIATTTTFTVTGTDGNGCQNTDQVIYTVNSLPTVNAGTDQTVCSGDPVTLSGSGASSYSWDNSISDGISFNPTFTQTYTLTGTDANGCVNTDQVDVFVNNLPNVDAGTDLYICSGASATLSGAGASSYSWDNGVADGISFTPGGTLTYTVTGTDANGCINTDQVDVIVNSLPSVNAGADQNICAGSSVTLSGTGAGIYSWDNGVTDAVAFSPASTQTYTVTGTDANGCVNTDQVVVTVNAAPTVNAGADQNICIGGTVTLNGSGANSYTWDNGVSDGSPFTPGMTKTYTVTGTDAGGCQATDQVDVIVNSLPTVDAGSNQTVCAGTMITLTASGAASYSWDNGVTDGVAFAAGSSTVYTVTGTDANGCVNTDQVFVIVNLLPSINAGLDQNVCIGNSVVLSGSGASSYAWDNGVSDGISFSPASTLTYTVTGTDANGCQNTDQVDVIVNSLPAVNAGTDQTVCDGADVILTGSGASSYTWDNGVLDGVIFNPSGTVNYTVTGTDGNGCQNTDQVKVFVNSLPSINAGLDQTICDGVSVTLSASGALSYSWDNGVTDGVSFTPGASLTYTVTGTDGNGCQSTDQVDVFVNALPSVDAGTDQNICIGNSVALFGFGASTYSWDNGVTDGVSFTPASTLTYTVTGTDGNGCINTDQVDVVVNSGPTVNAGPDQTVCDGATVVLGASGAINYSWDNGITDSIPFVANSSLTYTVTGTDANGCQNTDQVDVIVNALPSVDAGLDQTVCDGTIVNLAGSGATSYTWDNGVTDGVAFTPVSTLTYTLTGTDANGCVNTDQVDVIVNGLPFVDAGSDQIICAGTSVTLSGFGASSYSWDNGVTDGVSFTPASTLTYTLTGTDGNGCVNTDQVDVIVNALPTVNAGPDQTVCDGATVILHGTGAASYSWDNFVFDSIPFVVNSTLTYTVTGTDANGCQNTDQADIIVNGLPTVDAGLDQTICDGTAVTLAGAGATSYTWDNGVTDGIAFNPSSSLTYTVTGTDANGCQSTDQVDVFVNGLPFVDAGSDQTICAGTPVTLFGFGASTYSWDNGVTDAVAFTPASTLTYTVTGTDGNGCQNTDQVDVIVNTLPVVNAGPDQTVCDGATVLLHGTGAMNYTWDNFVFDSIPFVVNSTLTYTVTGTDANGCQNTDQADIIVNGLPTVDAGLDQTICDGTAVTLAGTGATSYTWDNGVTDGIAFNPSFSLTYTVTGTDLNGCQNTDQVDVFVNSSPLVDAGSDQIICAGTSITLSGSGANSYSWDNGVTDATAFTPVSTLTYTLTGTDVNGCQDTDQVDVIVNALPAVDAGFDQTVCNGSSVLLHGNGALGYLWDNGVFDSVPFTANSTQTYTVTGFDANGCQNTDQLVVNVIALPTVVTTSPLEVCEFESMVLTASTTAPILLWYDVPSGGVEITSGSTYTTPVLNSSTTYYVEAFENGCSSSRIPININVNGKPQITISSTDSDCGNTNGTATASIGSGTAPFTYYWSSGEQQVFSINGLTTGSYYFSVEDAKGCKAIAVTEVKPTSVSINPIVSNPTCFNQANGSIDLNVAGLSGQLTYLWNTGHNTGTVNNLKAGTYEVTITNDVGCVVTESFVLNQPGLIENTINTVLPSCGENDGSIIVSATTGGASPFFYSWSNGKTGANNANVTYGAYTLTTTDNNGCQVQNLLYLSEKDAPLIEGAITETQCKLTSGAINLDITPVAGDAVQSISWSNGQTTEDLNNLAAGNYVSFITTVNNCVAVNGWKVEIGKPTTQEICLVTVDSVTTTNLVVWEKVATTGIAYYNIYRESNQIDDYQLIDTVDFASISVFNDVIASPVVRSWRYKISAVDECGIESDLSAHHKTLHLNTFDLGASGVKVTWDKYEGTSFTNYVLWRYTDANGWENIATLPTSVLNFTDATPFTEAGLDYMVEIVLSQTCTATIWRAQDFNTSRSNKEKGIFNPGSGTGLFPNNSLVEFEDGQVTLHVYPNPFENSVTLDMEGAEKLTVSIFDIQGKLIQTQLCYQGQSVVDLSQVNDGVYFVRANINNQEQTIKIIKQ